MGRLPLLASKRLQQAFPFIELCPIRLPETNQRKRPGRVCLGPLQFRLNPGFGQTKTWMRTFLSSLQRESRQAAKARTWAVWSIRQASGLLMAYLIITIQWLIIDILLSSLSIMCFYPPSPWLICSFSQCHFFNLSPASIIIFFQSIIHSTCTLWLQILMPASSMTPGWCPHYPA